MSRAWIALLAVAGALAGVFIAVRLHTAAAQPPAAGGYLGVAEPSELTSYQQVDQFAAATGRKPDIVLYYSSWDQPFRTGFAAQVRAHGGTPFVQISPAGVSMAAVASGRYDTYLRSYAGQVRGYGHPVIIGFAPEMNGFWDSWGYGHTKAATWVAAWRHVVSLFRQAGAGNVTWLWTINVAGRGTGPIHHWWPGSAYVNWIGIDGYYFLATDTFSSSFEPTVAAVRKFTNIPILLSEVAIGQVARQAAKLPDLFAGVRANHLLGFVWFDESQHNGLYHQNWRLEGHPGGIAQFRHQLRTYQQPRKPAWLAAALAEGSRHG